MCVLLALLASYDHFHHLFQRNCRQIYIMSLSSPFTAFSGSRAPSEIPSLRNFGTVYNELQLGPLDFPPRASSSVSSRLAVSSSPHFHNQVSDKHMINRQNLELFSPVQSQLDADSYAILRSATHEDFMDAKNPTYMRLTKQLQDAHQEIEHLRFGGSGTHLNMRYVYHY